jgi:hypothetical protein
VQPGLSVKVRRDCTPAVAVPGAAGKTNEPRGGALVPEFQVNGVNFERPPRFEEEMEKTARKRACPERARKAWGERAEHNQGKKPPRD